MTPDKTLDKVFVNHLDYIKNDFSILEKEPLEKVAKSNQLMAYLHEGFWHCIDTKRDKDNLEEIFGKRPFDKEEPKETKSK